MRSGFSTIRVLLSLLCMTSFVPNVWAETHPSSDESAKTAVETESSLAPNSMDAVLVRINDWTRTRGQFLQHFSREHPDYQQQFLGEDGPKAFLMSLLFHWQFERALDAKGDLQNPIGQGAGRVSYAMSFQRTYEYQLQQDEPGTVTPEEIDAYLETHGNPLQRRGDRLLAWILVSGERDRVEALNRLRYLAMRAKRGDDFAELARMYSDDAETASQGGRKGWVAYRPEESPTELPNEVRNVLFRIADVGDVPDPIPLKSDFFIITMLDRKPDTLKDEASLRDNARGSIALQRSHQRAEYDQEQAAKDPRLHVDEELLNRLVEQGIAEDQIGLTLATFEGKPIVRVADLMIYYEMNVPILSHWPVPPSTSIRSFFQLYLPLAALAAVHQDHPIVRGRRLWTATELSRQKIIARMFESFVIGSWMLPDDEKSRHTYYDEIKDTMFLLPDQTGPNGEPVYKPFEEVQMTITKYILKRSMYERDQHIKEYIAQNFPAQVQQKVLDTIEFPRDILPFDPQWLPKPPIP